MKKTIMFCVLSCLIANVMVATQAATRRATPGSMPTATVPQGAALSAEQMDNLLAPIALYPDPLLAQMFPASTFVDQVEQAARWLRGNNGKTAGVDNQPWDVSVKSIAHYPQAVYMMGDKLDWTTALGQAYVNQSGDVLKSVQRLRALAKKAGFLATTPQQTVIVEQEVIKIVPANPQLIYVPNYNPQVVYVQPQSSGPSTGAVVATAAISFGVGLAIGAWLNNDCNWHTHTVYYHGWHGSGWIHASYGHIHVNSVYVNRSYSTIHVNRNVAHHNVNYNNINHYNNVHRNVNYNNVNVNNVNRNNVNVNNVNRNNVNTNNINTNNVNRNSVSSKNINANDARVNSMRGHTNTAQAGTANRTAMAQQRSSAFGGYGSSAQTRAASQRGQASRASAQQSRSFGGGGRSGGRRRN